MSKKTMIIDLQGQVIQLRNEVERLRLELTKATEATSRAQKASSDSVAKIEAAKKALGVPSILASGGIITTYPNTYTINSVAQRIDNGSTR